MSLGPRLRRFTLTAHVTLSVGWLGAVAAYLALAVAGLLRQDVQVVRAAYVAMELIGWYVIVPCSLAALLTGLVQSLGTEWGLFRHYWILAKFLLILGATPILLGHMRTVSHVAGLASQTALSGAELSAPRVPLVVHAGGGLLVLLAATVLSIYKPWGRTPYGRRQQHGRSAVASPLTAGVVTEREAGARTPWGRYAVVGLVGLILLFIVMHLAGGGFRRH